VTGENDLIVLKLKVRPAAAEGTVTLTAPEGGWRIRVWNDAIKTNEVTLPAQWDLSVQALPEKVYVEGISRSTVPRDVVVSLKYEHAGQQSEDKVALTVADVYTIQISAWIPVDHVESPLPFDGTLFLGDAPGSPATGGFSRDRRSVRMRQTLEVIADEQLHVVPLRGYTVGQTQSFDPATSLNAAGNLSSAALADNVRGAPMKLDWATATPSTNSGTSNRIDSNSIEVSLQMATADPLIASSPSIDWDLTIRIDETATGATYTVTGAHDGYPAIDIYINDSEIYTHDPRVTGDGLPSLGPPMEIEVNESGNLP
jgi:hypothetical protein